MGGIGSGAKLKEYPSELVTKVKLLYESGMTQHEVSIAIGVSQKVIYNLMRRCGIKTRVAAKRNQSGNNNHMWKGDKASYTALHFRVETELGKPNHCDVCGKTDESRYEWANLTGDYENVSDYKRMCVSCHRKFDAQRRKKTGMTTSPRNKAGAICPIR